MSLTSLASRLRQLEPQRQRGAAPSVASAPAQGVDGAQQAYSDPLLQLAANSLGLQPSMLAMLRPLLARCNSSADARAWCRYILSGGNTPLPMTPLPPQLYPLYRMLAPRLPAEVKMGIEKKVTEMLEKDFAALTKAMARLGKIDRHEIVMSALRLHQHLRSLQGILGAGSLARKMERVVARILEQAPVSPKTAHVLRNIVYTVATGASQPSSIVAARVQKLLTQLERRQSTTPVRAKNVKTTIAERRSQAPRSIAKAVAGIRKSLLLSMTARGAPAPGTSIAQTRSQSPVVKVAWSQKAHG